MLAASVFAFLASFVPTTQSARTQSASAHLAPLYGVIIPEWQGFGTSLSWWGCEAGGSSLESKYADLFFTNKSTIINVGGNIVSLPGLGLNIVGGSGQQGDYPGVTEFYKGDTSTQSLDWWKLVEGFWINGGSNSSSNWDWTRDANQRSMLSAAIKRNVNFVDLYSNAPMWWMTLQKSSLGGNLTFDGFSLFPEYLANVVQHAITNWKVNVTSVSILNEPSSDKWVYPNIDQEGVNAVNKSSKVALLSNLRARLDAFNLTSVVVAGSDEYNYDVAYGNLDGVVPNVGQFNVHGYEQDNAARGRLTTALGSTPLWMSQYTDSDDTGMTLATAILNDINHLYPTAWLYYQVLENLSGGLLLAADFGSSPTDPARAVTTAINPKYYLFAQFTRYIRPGDEILNSGHPDVILARDPQTNTYKFVVVVYKSSKTITLDLSGLPDGKPVPTGAVQWTWSAADGSALFTSFASTVTSKNQVRFRAHKNSVYSSQF